MKVIGANRSTPLLELGANVCTVRALLGFGKPTSLEQIVGHVVVGWEDEPV